MRSLQRRVEAPGSQWTRIADLYIPQAQYRVGYDCASTSKCVLGSFSKQQGGQSIDVVTEWKNYLGVDPAAKQLALSRADPIANQLAAPDKPESFPVLDCVG